MIEYTPSSNDGSPDDAANLAWLAAEALEHVETVESAFAARLKARLLASLTRTSATVSDGRAR